MADFNTVIVLMLAFFVPDTFYAISVNFDVKLDIFDHFLCSKMKAQYAKSEAMLPNFS